MASKEALAAAIEAAHRRIRPHVLVTPTVPAPKFSAQTGARIWLKCDNEQITGSFKLRGATNKLALADEAARARGFVTASTGNHALAMATALDALGITSGMIVMPTNADPGKVDALRRFAGVQLVFHGDDCVVAETYARALAEEQGRVFVSPYNDLDIIAGQGTAAVELLEQVPNVDVVFATVGGGGLMSGLATYIKHVRPSCRVVGCLPAASPVMIESVRAGKIVDIPSEDTLSDGSAGGIEPGSVTLPLCAEHVDEWQTATEDEIARAMVTALEHSHKVIEGAAGVALAVALREAPRFPGANVAVFLCGANVSLSVIKRLLAEAP